MKTVLILIATIALSLARPEQGDEYKDHAITPFMQCSSIYSFNITMMKEVSADIIPENDPILGNWLKCYWQLLKFVDENGYYDYERIKELLVLYINDRYHQVTSPGQLADNTLEHCKNTPKHDNMEVEIVKYKNCLMKYLIETVINIDSNYL